MNKIRVHRLSPWRRRELFFLALIALIVLLVAANWARAYQHLDETQIRPGYSRIVVFGDSLSDIGNNTWVQTVSTKTGVYTGAPVTNDIGQKRGVLWPEDLQNLLQRSALVTSQKIIPSAHWHQQKHVSIDFAYAGAVSGSGYTNDAGEAQPACTAPGKFANQVCIPALGTQVSLYLKQGTDRKALYFIWVGGNNIFNDANALRGHWPSLTLSPSDGVVSAVERLLSAGVPANHIAVLTLPDITLMSMAEKTLTGRPILKWLIQQQVALFNLNLKAGLAWLDIWHKGAVQVVPMNQLFTYILHHPKALQPHYTHVDQMCINSKSGLKNGCQGYLFYNAKHPTTQTEHDIALFVAAELGLPVIST